MYYLIMTTKYEQMRYYLLSPLWRGLDFKEHVNLGQGHQACEAGPGQSAPLLNPHLRFLVWVVFSPSHFAFCIGGKKTLKVLALITQLPPIFFKYNPETWFIE